MESPAITTLPVAGVGVMTAAVSGQFIFALVMVSLCALVTGILILRHDPEESDL